MLTLKRLASATTAASPTKLLLRSHNHLHRRRFTVVPPPSSQRQSLLCIPLNTKVIMPSPRTSIAYHVPVVLSLAKKIMETKDLEQEVAVVWLDQTRDPKKDTFFKIGVKSVIVDKSAAPEGFVTLDTLGKARVRVVGAETVFFDRSYDAYPTFVEVEQDDGTLPTDEAPLKKQLEEVARILGQVCVAKEEKCQLDDMLTNSSDLSAAIFADMLFGIFAKNVSEEKCVEIVQEMDTHLRIVKIINVIKQHTNLRSDYLSLEKEFKDSEVRPDKFYHSKLGNILQKLSEDGDGTDSDASKFQVRMLSKNVPEHVDKAFRQELSRFRQTEPYHSEHQTLRNYLEWMTQLPWGVYSQDKLDIDSASAVLDADHYGMDDVKKRILEFIAIGFLKGDVGGKIMCFSGPPGVGKTSIASSIAKALGRKFERISMAGVYDVAVVKGHRRTYIGSAPGAFISALKRCETSNPVILIDEIDKAGVSHRGDPAAALLEALDPSQNSSFADYYLDVGVDLSKVLFLATANYPNMISPPLLDRMEVIELASYVPLQKLEIAKRHLIPKAVKSCGLTDETIAFDDFAVEKLISYYCREPGVRSLERHIEKCARKVALKIKMATETSVRITPENLQEYAGFPPYSDKSVFGENYPVGLVNRFSPSGSVSHVETIVLKKEQGKGELKLTGRAESVVQEASKVCWSLCKKFLTDRGFAKEATFFDDALVHMHLLGGYKKAEAQEGLPVAISFMSLALDRPVPHNIAFSGEVTLNGKVRKSGALRERYIGALRHGAKKLFVSKDCEIEFEEFPKEILGDLEIKFVTNFHEVFDEIFHQEEVAGHSKKHTSTAIESPQ
eukprot:TRINITY_DN7642_c0_g2_i1.p1 TRINITY_DN7642_c0_g2~~TRINITY_DN7642_c0_g2_i1.p1  ORF type:complete len:840 (-),score=225.33 TRINITY_DN7642_c0_g2_i1:1787-4306(-)